MAALAFRAHLDCCLFEIEDVGLWPAPADKHSIFLERSHPRLWFADGCCVVEVETVILGFPWKGFPCELDSHL